MHKPESVLENETDRILWDFEIQTDHLIPLKRPELVVANQKKKKKKKSQKKKKKDIKRTCRIVNFAVSADYRMKIKENERQVLGPCRRTLKKIGNIKVTVILIVIGAFRTITKCLIWGLEVFEIGGQTESI